MMPNEYDIIIADTSCFILLVKIGELAILHEVFNNISTTPEIASEFGEELPNWVEIRPVKNKEYLKLLQLDVDNGEASAIALAIESSNALLIVDDYKARKLVARLQLSYTGTLGIILKAKQSGIIASIKPVIEKIQLTNFRFSEKIYKEILKLADEL